MAFENLQVSVADGVGTITLYRPKAMNALCSPLMDELTQVLDDWENNADVRAVVITGAN